MGYRVDMQLLGYGVCAYGSLLGVYTGYNNIGYRGYRKLSSPPPFDISHKKLFFLSGAITGAAIATFLLPTLLDKQFRVKHIVVLPMLAWATAIFSLTIGAISSGCTEVLFIRLVHHTSRQFRLIFGSAAAAATLFITGIFSRILTGSYIFKSGYEQIGVSLAVGILYSNIKKPESVIHPFINRLFDNGWFNEGADRTLPDEVGFEYRLLNCEIIFFPDDLGRKLGRLFREKYYIYHPGLIDYDIKKHCSDLHVLGDCSRQIRAYKSEVSQGLRMLHPMVSLEKIIDVIALLLSFEPNAVIQATQADYLHNVVIHNICKWLPPSAIVCLSRTSRWHYRCIASSDGREMWTAKKLDCMRSLLSFNEEAALLACPKDLLGRLSKIESMDPLRQELELYCNDSPTTFSDLSSIAGEDKHSAIVLVRYLHDHPELLNDPAMTLSCLRRIASCIESYGLPWAALRPLTARMRRAIIEQDDAACQLTEALLGRCRRDFPNVRQFVIPVDRPEIWDN